MLKSKQGNLRDVKSDTLREYLSVKDERQTLKKEIDSLKKMIENTPVVSEDTIKELGRRIREGNLSEQIRLYPRSVPEDLGTRFYEVFASAEDRLSLDLDLMTLNVSCEPVYHPIGGVADFRISYKGQAEYASTLFKGERFAYMLDKWERMTSDIPAYKILAKREEERQKMEQYQQQREQQKERRTIKFRR